MKSTYLYLSLALISLALLTSCGPDANNPTPEVTALTLSATTANLSVDETLQLTASVTPADAKVTFTTDNAAVATVCEKGVVKAIAPGTATITAQAGDKKATCTVTVVPAEEENVALLNMLEGEMYPSGSTVNYVASISQEQAENYEMQLFFSVLKTAKYTLSLTFDEPISGSICVGVNCLPVTDKSSYTTDLELLADTEGAEIGKKENQPTPLGVHPNIPTPPGQTYKNRIVVKLTPKDGSKTLTWTVNLAITIR